MKKIFIFLWLLVGTPLFSHELIKRAFTTFCCEMQFFLIDCNDRFARAYALDSIDPLTEFTDGNLPLEKIVTNREPMTKENAYKAFGKSVIDLYEYSEEIFIG